MDLMRRRREMMHAEKPWRFVTDTCYVKYTTFADGGSLLDAKEWHIYGTITSHGGYLLFRFPRADLWSGMRLFKDLERSDYFRNGSFDIVITIQSPTEYIVNGMIGGVKWVNELYTLKSGKFGGFDMDHSGALTTDIKVYAR